MTWQKSYEEIFYLYETRYIYIYLNLKYYKTSIEVATFYFILEATIETK
jgi:hypothetical protein